MRTRQFIHGVTLAVLLGLTGCRTTQLKPDDESAITAGQKSFILFRATVSDPKDPQRILPMRGFRAFLARMDPPERIRVYASNYDDMSIGPRVLAPTSSSAADGWRCLALEPGTYYLELNSGQNIHLDFCEHAQSVRNVPRDIAPGLQSFGRHGQIFSNEFRLLPAYRIEVPSNAPVVYAGRFHLEQRLENRSGFSPYKRVHLGDSSILDESADARSIALERFPNLSSKDFHCRLATPLADASRLRTHLPGKIESIPGAPFTTTDVASRAAGTYGGPLVWLAEYVNNRSGSVCCAEENDEEEVSFRKDMADLALSFAAAPFAIAADKLAGDPIRKKWAPREKELGRQFEDFKFEQRLAQALAEKLEQRRAVPDGSKASTTLQIQPTRVCLREVLRGQFALEVAVHFRLRDAEHSQVLWEQTLVTSDSSAARASEYWFLPFPFEALVDNTSTARPLSAYELPAGQVLLQNDLDDAVRALASGFMEIVGAAPVRTQAQSRD